MHRGGDRQLNRAIHIIALGRMAWDPETRAYIERRVSEGKTKREALRCLKRHIARQIWHLLYNPQPIAASTASATTTQTRHRRCSRTHAMHPVKPANSEPHLT